MSQFELLIETLELLLTAPTENDLKETVSLAADLSSGFTEKQIEKAKSQALRNVEISNA